MTIRSGSPPDFSLVLGGPLFQLLRRAHLSDDALLLVRQRIIVIALPGLAAAPGALGPGRTGCWAGARPSLPAGRGGARPLPGGAAAVDRRRAGGAPAHAVRW
ncbi:MAG: hypothetical protein M0C28_16695 [Candidatus Moduliflexus flocculans]|nr:hypothetical protein [Candidatus Moduliflexus flocculans]